MGKSTLAAQARSLGIPVHDSDAAVHAFMQSGGAAFAKIEKTFPDVVVNGTIDRQKLGKIVFGDPEKRRVLEGIIHPLVRADSQKFIRLATKARHRFCILDIPLLFETGRHRHMDEILTVSAPKFVQRRRVSSRPNMTPEKFISILNAQVPDHKKRVKSDHVILSAQGKRHTLGALKRLKKEIANK